MAEEYEVLAERTAVRPKAEEGEEAVVVPPEHIEYFVEDQRLRRLIEEDEHLRQLYPLYQRLVRLTFLDKREAELLKYDIEIVSELIYMFAPMEKRQNPRWVAKLEAVTAALKAMVNDALHGRKIKALVGFHPGETYEEEVRRRWPL